MTFENFRDNLTNFNDNKKELKRLSDLYEYNFYMLTGVKSPNLTKPHTSFNESFVNEIKLSKIDILNEIGQEIDYLKLTQKLTLKCLNRQEPDIKEMLIRIFLNGETQTKVALNKGFDNSTQLMREIKKRWIK